eukprot:scaffold559_cov358-Prasinococcus_capsulatus_cf.AAC.5
MARGTVVLVVFCADESKLERRHDRTIWRLHRWPRLFAGRPGSPGASKGSRVPTWNGNCCGHHRRFGIHGRSAARLGHDRYNRDLGMVFTVYFLCGLLDRLVRVAGTGGFMLLYLRSVCPLVRVV